jgi:hypothetical protein
MADLVRTIRVSFAGSKVVLATVDGTLKGADSASPLRQSSIPTADDNALVQLSPFLAPSPIGDGACDSQHDSRGVH